MTNRKAVHLAVQPAGPTDQRSGAPPVTPAAIRPAHGVGTADHRETNTENWGEPWVVRPEKVAALLDISRSKVYEMLATGDLPSVLIGRCRRIPVEALRTWLAGQSA